MSKYLVLTSKSHIPVPKIADIKWRYIIDSCVSVTSNLPKRNVPLRNNKQL